MVGLRERTRRAVRAELMTVAMQLFLEHGFEETTVEQIATAAGLSRRSFFRYFASKDDILGEALASTGQGIAAALTARPATEEPWIAIRRAFDPLLAGIESDERALPMTRMMLQSPALNTSHLNKQTSWQNAIATALEASLDGNPHDVRVRSEALAAAAMACLTTAQARWALTDDQTPLAALLDTTMSAVHPLSDTRL